MLSERSVYPGRVEAPGGDSANILYSFVDEAAALIRAALDTEPDEYLREACLIRDWSSVAPIRQAIEGLS